MVLERLERCQKQWRSLCVSTSADRTTVSTMIGSKQTIALGSPTLAYHVLVACLAGRDGELPPHVAGELASRLSLAIGDLAKLGQFLASAADAACSVHFLAD